MFPSEWRNVPEKVLRNFDACALAFPDRVPNLVGVPEDDDRREQVQPRDPEVLGSGRPVPDLSLASESWAPIFIAAR